MSKILVVDDEKILRDLLQFRLEAKGYTIEVAENGKDCLEKAAKNKPDLILLDIMMPEMDGLEVVKVLRSDEKYAGIKVLLLSAKGSQMDVETGIAAGADGYMAKPFRAENLVQEVEKLLESK